ncbi:MAG: hypothetical protein A3H44_11235 [Gammaproteobacteria bacterium RIFCSPLOWO2_02_FULL_57_10]|nr:MAG: hypothetical protein A3H44_11235 [Gammaproteobacteria bacterium RIFCSPLOWO2_02_FULL_57_10]
MARPIAFLYGVICYTIFFLTFLYLIGFVANLLVPKSIDVGVVTPVATALTINMALIALFGIQHSVMARPAFKERLARVLPRTIERSTYVLASSVVLILLFWQWRPLTAPVWSVQSEVAKMLLWAGMFGGFLVVLLSTFIISHFELFGLRQVWLNLRRQSYSQLGFSVKYMYRFVRHPLYLGFIFAFWATPHMTVGHLLFAVGMTIYILVGIRYEERDLVHFLGADYADYRGKVPMLIPKFGKGHSTVK